METIDRDITGTILHFEKMALYDGQGLRTVVFFKGCPLRCLWCSTPSSQQFKTELGYNHERCRGCAECIEACPHDAICFDEKTQKIVRETEVCRHCFSCVKACPAYTRYQYGQKVTAGQVLEELEKDAVFYFHSGGGVTLSGGEALAQPAFARAILTGCRQSGYHTAIETSGFVPWSHFADVLPLLDSLLIDIKIMDDKEHIRLTGESNKRILENICKVDQSNEEVELFIRIPLIPGVNDSEENLSDVILFCKKLSKFKELHLLPYHRLGVPVYQNLNRPYALEDISPAGLEWAQEKADWIRKQGIAVRVEG